MKNTKFVVILLFIGIFLAGIGTGYFGALYFHSSEATEVQPPQRITPPGEERPTQGTNPRMREWMIRELNLNPDQQEPFFQLLHDMRSESRALFMASREELERNMREHHNHFMQELAEVLNEDQLKAFEERFSRQAMQQQREFRHRNSNNGNEPPQRERRLQRQHNN